MHYDSSMIKVLLSYLTLVVALCESHLADLASKTKLADDNHRVGGHGCRIQNHVRIICSGINSEEEIHLPNRNINHLNTEINSLVIENANLTSLNLTTSLFSRIGLNNSSRSHISSLKKLQIVNTTLEHINICSPTKEEEDGENTNGGHHDLIDCQFLSGLNSLDLRDNNLKRLEEFKLDGLVELYLSGNSWFCLQFVQSDEPKTTKTDQEHEKSCKIAPMTDWFVRDYGDKLKDENQTHLAIRPMANTWSAKKPWFSNQSSSSSNEALITNVNLLHFLKFNQRMEATCPTYCRCSTKVVRNEPLTVKVSCDHANLTALPQELPENTELLDVSYNKIKSLEPLRTNKHYKHLRQLIALENELTSMSALFNSPFVANHPTTLDLRANNIEMFDINLLKPIVESSNVGYVGFRVLLFGENPWSCDCEHVNEIQQFLWHYKDKVPDAEELSCDDDQETFLIKLDYNELCNSSSGIDVMTIVVVVEVILLILLFSKFAYDVRHYNQTGELPWLARHLCLGYSGIKSGKQQNEWYQDENPYNINEDQISGNSTNGSRRYGFGLVLRCFYRTTSSLNSSESSGRLNPVSSFRPRRHTNSTSNGSSKIQVTKSPASMLKNNHIKQNDLELIERCSSMRSAKSSTASSSQDEVVQQPRIKKLSMIERIDSLRSGKSSVVSNREEVAQPRMKKISTDDAAKFRKDILDPTNDEIQEQPLIHQTDSESMEEDTSDFVKGNTNRKISRLQRSKKISDGSLSDGIFTL